MKIVLIVLGVIAALVLAAVLYLSGAYNGLVNRFSSSAHQAI